MRVQEPGKLQGRSLAVDTSVRAAGDGKSLLNLGCGADCHPAFVNVDLVARPGVLGHDLRQGIPFPDSTYDLVYHSTMLSHLRPNDALGLMTECRRVLKTGGVLRVVTEDLEQMCRVYLHKLEAAASGDRQSEPDYEWMILELFDQAAREYPGGGMVDYLSRDPLLNESFIYSRVGEQGRRMISGARSLRNRRDSRPSKRHLLTGLRAKARKLVLSALLGPLAVRELEVGRFRLSSGQVSYRMYDRFSLGRLFTSAGFSNISLRAADQSAYPFWDDVNLDVSAEGVVARPHALIMEGTRLAATS
jgi:predicted SAM-dependent methyltransferase